MRNIVLSLPIILLSISIAWAHTDGAYYHGDKDLAPKNNWMKSIPDYRKINRISIPGTHDTASFYGGDITQTQSLSITQQLNAGIRFLDIRVKQAGNKFDIYHGIQYQRANFDNVLDEVTNFLKKNLSETVLMRVSRVSDSDMKTYDETFRNYIKKYQNFFYSANKNFDPLLCETRGKIILYPTDKTSILDEMSLQYQNAFTDQDDYHLVTNWDLHAKWEKILDYLKRANNNVTSNYKKTYLNHLSGSGGSFPYFVASGHSSPGTDAPRLLTGAISRSSDRSKYPAFPRVGCFLSLCSIVFEGTNTLTKDYLVANKSKLNYVGIIVADFPGQELINAIIQINPLNFNAALGDKFDACTEAAKKDQPTASNKPCDVMLKNPQHGSLVKKAASSWSEQEKNAALTLITEAAGISGDSISRWLNDDLANLLKMDCDALRKDPKYNTLLNAPPKEWPIPTWREPVVEIISKATKIDNKKIKRLTNQELMFLLRGKN